jgi:hypothetical protein
MRGPQGGGATPAPQSEDLAPVSEVLASETQPLSAFRSLVNRFIASPSKAS